VSNDRFDRAEITHNRALAREALEVADELLDSGHPRFAAANAYYAAFYAATAALLNRGHSFKTHSGLVSAFHQHLVRSGDLSADAGSTMSSLLELRFSGQYGAHDHPLTRDEAARAVAAARNLVGQIESLIEKEKRQ